jgi:hypothetical protein
VAPSASPRIAESGPAHKLPLGQTVTDKHFTDGLRAAQIISLPRNQEAGATCLEVQD